jgi:hypothetical protein
VTFDYFTGYVDKFNVFPKSTILGMSVATSFHQLSNRKFKRLRFDDLTYIDSSIKRDFELVSLNALCKKTNPNFSSSYFILTSSIGGFVCYYKGILIKIKAGLLKNELSLFLVHFFASQKKLVDVAFLTKQHFLNRLFVLKFGLSDFQVSSKFRLLKKAYQRRKWNRKFLFHLRSISPSDK